MRLHPSQYEVNTRFVSIFKKINTGDGRKKCIMELENEKCPGTSTKKQYDNHIKRYCFFKTYHLRKFYNLIWRFISYHFINHLWGSLKQKCNDFVFYNESLFILYDNRFSLAKIKMPNRYVMFLLF